jgi:hypothetical protein
MSMKRAVVMSIVRVVVLVGWVHESRRLVLCDVKRVVLFTHEFCDAAKDETT